MEFRLLRADEVDARVSTVSEKGCSLLLYKDARVDQNILDETVGTMNWQRSHQLIGDRLYCTVSIWDSEKGQWISKQDVGTESYTEKEKGQASDSFKRACFNLGIGRELYTAPFMWVPASKCNITPKNGGYTTYDTFTVTQIEYKDKNIVFVQVYNNKTKQYVDFGKASKNLENANNNMRGGAPLVTEKQVNYIKTLCKKNKDATEKVKKYLDDHNYSQLADMKMSEASELLEGIK